MSKLDEEREFEELAAMEEFEAQEQANTTPTGDQRQKGQTHFVNPDTGRTEKLPEEMQPTQDELIESDKEMVQAMGYGAVEGVPFAKDAASALETVMTTGTKNFGEQYHANLEEWNEAINDAEAKNPAAFMAGDIAAGTMLPIKGIKGAMAFGALSSASRLEDRNPFEMVGAAVAGAAVTGGLSAGISGAASLTNYVGKKLGILAAHGSKEAVGAFAGKNIKRLNRHIRKTGTPDASSTTKTVEFARRINNTMVEGEPLLGTPLVGQSFSRTAEKAKIAMQSHGSKLKTVVSDLDELVPDEINGKQLYDKMYNKMGISKMLTSDDPATVKLGKQYTKQIQDQFMDAVEEIVPVTVKRPSGLVDSKGDPVLIDEIVDSVKKKMVWKKLTPKQIHELKIDHGQTSRKVSSGFEKLNVAEKQRALSMDETFDTSLNSTLNDVMDEVSAKAGKIKPEIAKLYRDTNRDYSDMIMVEKIAQDQADSMSSGPMETLKRALGVRGLLVAQLQSTTGANAVMASAAGAAINQTISNPSTGNRMAKMLDKTAKFIQTNPDSPFLKRLVLAAQVSSYSDKVNDSYLQDAVASIGAEISLLENPIARNYASIEAKSDLILEALQYHDPAQAEQFRQALKAEDKESLRIMMDQASKLPELRDMFEDGKGIDGRVYTEEDKQALRDEVEGMDISLKQKLQHLDGLNKSGIIPQVQEEPERFFKPEWRDKNKPKY